MCLIRIFVLTYISLSEWVKTVPIECHMTFSRNEKNEFLIYYLKGEIQGNDPPDYFNKHYKYLFFQ